MFDTEQNFIVLLDLEETLIKSWDEPVWIPTGDNVTKFLHGEWTGDPTPFQGRMGLMSWAVWDEGDKRKFNEELRPELEERLRFKFSDELVFSMEDWASMVLEASGLKLERSDLFDMCKKEDVLFKLRKHKLFHHTSTWLLDDAVAKFDIIQNIDNRSKFFIRNIKSLFDADI